MFSDTVDFVESVQPVIKDCSEKYVTNAVINKIESVVSFGISAVLDVISEDIAGLVCEAFEVGAISTHFINAYNNPNNLVDIGYDLGAIYYDLEGVATENCET